MKGGCVVRRIFLLALALVILSLCIPWVVVQLRPEAEPPAEASTAFLPDDQTTLTVLRDGETVTVTMAEWLPGVLAAEMPASFEPEALRAQAVAARSYIADRAAHRTDKHPDADICSDYACCCAWSPEETLRENWGDDADKNMARIRAAVADTDGQYLVYDGAPIRAVFHSSSAGATEASAALWGGTLPYLVSVSSPETADDVPNYVSTVDVTTDDFRTTLLEAYPDCVLPEDAADWLGSAVQDDSGRVATQEIGSLTLTGAQVRSLFSLRSAAFTTAYADGVFRFTTTGYGHGVGMSQYGANVMAKSGSGYADILAHYYPGTTLVQAA